MHYKCSHGNKKTTDSQSIFLRDEDSVSQYSIDGYMEDIHEDATEKAHRM